MEYTVNKLARLSGISTRTLRYYDQIGLLSPERLGSNGYRYYGQAQVDILQQILFYRELGFGLENIGSIVTSENFDRKKALLEHLQALKQEKERLEKLIENIKKTIKDMKGEITMSDKEKFGGFKQKLVSDNEREYGKEARKKYGDDAVNASNAKVLGMSEEQYKNTKALSAQIAETLKEAIKTGNPAGTLAQKACDLHREWLCMFWKEGFYSKAAHRELGEMYVKDERFRDHYERIAKGAAEFFRDALIVYCAD